MRLFISSLLDAVSHRFILPHLRGAKQEAKKKLLCVKLILRAFQSRAAK